MGLSYLKGKNWIEVTREERLFCSYLYCDIQKDVNSFLKLLKTQPQNYRGKVLSNLNNYGDWEIGFEVCFYRDIYYLYKSTGETASESLASFPLKRTFDLCLFSESRIIIIEAKVQQGFDDKQIKYFLDDKNKYIPEILGILGKTVQVDVVALASSQYFKNCTQDTINSFDAYITWQQISEKYKPLKKINIYQQADIKYKQ
ncbi:hypothetical protein ACFLU8_05265 [Chloroflexota bacterium]